MARRFTRHPHTAGRIIEGQAHVITAEHSKMHTLNAAATVIWELARDGCTAQEATRAIVQEFDVDEKTARTDVEGCLQDLVARQILVAEA